MQVLNLPSNFNLSSKTQCCGSGYWIRCLFDPWTRIRDPGSGIGFFWIRILDLRSRIPTPYFLELSHKFLGKKFYNSLKIGPNFFLNEIIFNFANFVAPKKGLTTNFCSPLSFVVVFGSGIRDLGSGIRNV